MFITLQFPLFDYRFVKAEPNRADRPSWPEPDDKERIRYFGKVIGRHTPYKGPWDDEKKYCDAHNVINLCGLGEEHFYKKLLSSPTQSRVLFRRFQSDGKCMAKFELGINDILESTLQASSPADTAKQIYQQIQKYLLCPVKLKIGSKLSPYIPLVDSGNKLKSAYYWATQKGKKTFAEKDVYNEVDSCEPILLVQLNAAKLDLSAMKMEKVDMPELFNDQHQLYYQYISYDIGGTTYHLKTWFICTNGTYGTNPVLSYEFGNYNQTIRYLRINLLRIHTEIILQKKLMRVFDKSNQAFKITDEQTRDRLWFYLHKILLNLSDIKRNKLPQQKLVEISFGLNELYYGGAGIDEQIELLQEYKKWLKTLKPTPQNGQVIGIVESTQKSLQKLTVFISYSSNDKSTAVWLREKLITSGISVILDSYSIPAASNLRKFILESLKNTHATVSIVSDNSLISDWVGLETKYSLVLQELNEHRKLIPCYLDDKLFKDNGYATKKQGILKTKLAEIGNCINDRIANNKSIADLTEPRDRLLELDSNLAHIIEYLRATNCIDIRPDHREQTFVKLLSVINTCKP